MPIEAPEAVEPGPRVLLCIPTLGGGGGGAERQVRLLAPALVERGIRLSIFSRLAKADLRALTAAGVSCYPIRAAGNHNPALAVEMLRAARTARAQVIHTWLTQMDILGGAAALATRRPWILSERSSPDGYSGRAKDRLRAFLGHRADTVIANSASGLDVWPAHPNCFVIRNGVDHRAIAEAPREPLAARAEDSGRTIIVSVARLVPSKRIDMLLRALVQIRREIADVLLVLVGQGPEAPALKALAARLGVAEQVLFAGFQPDAWSWIKAASVFVSASLFEGEPNAVLEAAVAGTPQVLSNIEMHRHAVGGGGARYFQPQDADALAAAVVTLVRDPEAARAVAAVAREAVRDHSVDLAAERYAEIYRKAAGQVLSG